MKYDISKSQRLMESLIVNNQTKRINEKVVIEKGNHALVMENGIYYIKKKKGDNYEFLLGESNKNKFAKKRKNEAMNMFNLFLIENEYYLEVPNTDNNSDEIEMNMDMDVSDDSLDVDVEETSKDEAESEDMGDNEAASIAGKAASIVRDGDESSTKNVLNSIASAVKGNDSVPDESKEKLKNALEENDDTKKYKPKKNIAFYQQFFNQYNNGELKNNEDKQYYGGELNTNVDTDTGGEMVSETTSRIEDPKKGEMGNPVNSDSKIEETFSEIEQDKNGKDNIHVNTNSIIEKKEYDIVKKTSLKEYRDKYEQRVPISKKDELKAKAHKAALRDVEENSVDYKEAYNDHYNYLKRKEDEKKNKKINKYEKIYQETDISNL